MDSWQQVIALMGSVVASAFGLMRLVLRQNKENVDRLASVLEESVRHQQESSERLHEAIGALNESMRAVTKSLQVSFDDRRNE